MSSKTANVEITRRTDLAIKGRVYEFRPGERRLIPEPLVDRLVAAGTGRRLIARGKRLETAMIGVEGGENDA